MRLLATVAVIALASAGAVHYLADRAERADRAAAAARAPAAPVATPGQPLVLHADTRGHFITQTTINGRAVTALVDTGASMVALPFEEARRMGLTFQASDFRHPVSTANGVVQTAQVFLAEVRLGPHAVTNVRAVVMPAGVLEKALLGMTFLSRIGRIEIENGRRLTVRAG